MNKLINATKKALNVIMHPNAVREHKNSVDAIKFYYNAAVIPGIISIILSGLVLLKFGVANSNLLLSKLPAHANPAMLFAIGALTGFLYVFILTPISAMISSVVYQFFAKKLFKIWTKDISRTFTASLYANFLVIFFIWVTLIPQTNIAASMADSILIIWSFVMLIILISKQQEISKLRAFGGVLLSIVIIALIIFGIAVAILL